ncbi:McrB family protein [Streptomyces sp. NPDC002889]|uniref:McrB family protein n=1 Tax=Streptomyces sp. NPDC002889 TaxID=3364669 RepID=UPI0036AA9C93
MTGHWDISGRDVVPELRALARPADVGAALLHAMLHSDGKPWKAPYEDVRKNLGIRSKPVAPELQEQANQRFRTYMALFRGLGLLYEDGGTLHSTNFGNKLLELLEIQYQRVDDFSQELHLASRPQLARLVVPVLAKYQLENPLSSTKYPDGTDIRPLLAIWRAMRALDNKLHWEELGRALTPCLRDSDVTTAIQRISAARSRPGYNPSDPILMDSALGPRQPDAGADQSDRLDTWFSRAAFKGLLLEPRDRPDGYRHLSKEYIPLLDEAIANPPEFNETSTRSEYVQWLGSAGSSVTVEPSTDVTASRVVDKCRRYGDRQIIALVGPAGTGKTRIAEEAALILAEGDPTRILTVQFHASFTYEEFVGGLAPIGGTFEPTPGALVRINDAALSHPGKTHVLIVDELSRADVANVLGELLTYIEYRDRPFLVPSLSRDVTIARNLVVIATLNPADRSVVNMDDALVRRLRQIEIPRDSGALDRILAAAGMDEKLRSQVVQWFEELPADAPFGHGLFVGIQNPTDLHDLWHESIRFFLRRGGLNVYPEPERIEQGYPWRHGAYAESTEAP